MLVERAGSSPVFGTESTRPGNYFPGLFEFKNLQHSVETLAPSIQSHSQNEYQKRARVILARFFSVTTCYTRTWTMGNVADITILKSS